MRRRPTGSKLPAVCTAGAAPGGVTVGDGGRFVWAGAVVAKTRAVEHNEPQIWAAARRWHNSNSYSVALLTSDEAEAPSGPTSRRRLTLPS